MGIKTNMSSDFRVIYSKKRIVITARCATVQLLMPELEKFFQKWQSEPRALAKKSFEDYTAKEFLADVKLRANALRWLRTRLQSQAIVSTNQLVAGLPPLYTALLKITKEFSAANSSGERIEVLRKNGYRDIEKNQLECIEGKLSRFLFSRMRHPKRGMPLKIALLDEENFAEATITED